MSTLAGVSLWGRTIGAVSLEDGAQHAAFQYTPEFVASAIEVAPLTMPLSHRVHVFPELALQTFHGLPGLLADSLPDRFGNALIDVWLARQGRTADSFNAVERLCYTGARGMGALEFEPALGPSPGPSKQLQVDALVALATDVLKRRAGLTASLDDPAREQTLNDILRVGTSAGGARAKAVIAWNPHTNEVRSGQVPGDRGFEDWILKFDGVDGDDAQELADPRGFGCIEYAYHLMATAAGIRMQDCRLMHENGRHHFMTRRFDRAANGRKLHMQSLGALAHFDFNDPIAHSYEQAILVIRELKLGMSTLEEQFRRMVFNVMGRNQDDHVKNIAFLMDRAGNWSLSPAFDLTYSHNPQGNWTARHQMSVNGKHEGFEHSDLIDCAHTASLKRTRARDIIAQVRDAVLQWPEFAAIANVPSHWVDTISANLRLNLAR